VPSSIRLFILSREGDSSFFSDLNGIQDKLTPAEASDNL
jgi:hypothetical protein